MSKTNAQIIEQVQKNTEDIKAIKIRNNKQAAAISKAENFVSNFEKTYLTTADAEVMIDEALSDVFAKLIELNGEEPDSSGSEEA